MFDGLFSRQDTSEESSDLEVMSIEMSLTEKQRQYKENSKKKKKKVTEYAKTVGSQFL